MSPLRIEDIELRVSSRRDLLAWSGHGFGGLALSYLLGGDGLSADPEAKTGRLDLRPCAPHFAAPARAVIQLVQTGGPPQMDLFDRKPELQKRHGQVYEVKTDPFQPGSDNNELLACPFKFRRYGQCGMELSELIPHIGSIADEICLVRSARSAHNNHPEAATLLASGKVFSGRPTLGAWLSYALGTENQNLPAYIVLDDPAGLPVNGVQNWQAGFLPPVYQGTRFRSTGKPVLNLDREYEEAEAVVKLERDLIGTLDRIHRRRRSGQPQLDARIASYELAARMQLAASDALDISQETAGTQKRYGVGGKDTDSYGRRCLIARRLVERGVRFVQLFINFQIWDNHTNIGTSLPGACRKTDQPIAALLEDLDERGLLDSTLLAWGGEFGRLPIAQLPGDKNVLKAGRDHNQNAMVTWLAGAGIKRGHIHGTTDEIGLKAGDQKVTVHDWHATVLHQLGMHHEELFHRRNGLKERLTSVFPARVIDEICS